MVVETAGCRLRRKLRVRRGHLLAGWWLRATVEIHRFTRAAALVPRSIRWPAAPRGRNDRHRYWRGCGRRSAILTLRSSDGTSTVRIAARRRGMLSGKTLEFSSLFRSRGIGEPPLR